MKWLSVVAAVVLVVLTMHPGGGSTLDILPLVSCQPDCSGVADGGKAPDPTSCKNYYICVSGIAANEPTVCTTGNFNPLTATCDAAYTDCTAPCTPGGGGCPLSCNGVSLFIADVTDCSSYYTCTPSGPVGPTKCPDDQPYFDGKNCVDDESLCCSGYCEPYCDDGKVGVIPDPKDCTKFYYCEGSEGTPDDTVHFTCPSGQIFDVATLECVAGDANSCVTLCEADGGNGGGGGGGGSSGCVSSLTCSAAGNYAACDTCDPQYFDCSAAGAAGVLKTCPDGNVFNPNPDYPICVMEKNCPYP